MRLVSGMTRAEYDRNWRRTHRQYMRDRARYKRANGNWILGVWVRWGMLELIGL